MERNAKINKNVGEGLMHAMARMNPDSLMLSERSQTQKAPTAMARPEQANPWRQDTDSRLPVAGGRAEWGVSP